MKFHPLDIKGVYLIEIDYKSDDRGGFARTFCKEEFENIGHSREFVQLNQSWNNKTGTIRGMHYQIPPFKEIKLVRCISGSVYDVIVDLRKGSSTFLRSVTVELSEENKKMLYIPEGFAHGFQTLEDDTQLVYHHTEYYKPGFEAALHYADPALAIKWPLPVTAISDRDRAHPYLTESFKGLE
jgi:dTDP-4-dehydrorhamnose 3,5-epimerase